MPYAFLDAQNVSSIRQVLGDVCDALTEVRVDDCDLAEIQEIIVRASVELEQSRPSVATLSTYLNSLARSLRFEPNARTLVVELDAAMRAAHVPTNWEH